MKKDNGQSGAKPLTAVEMQRGVIKRVVCDRARKDCFDCPHATEHYADALADPEPCTKSPCVLHGCDVKCEEVL